MSLMRYLAHWFLWPIMLFAAAPVAVEGFSGVPTGDVADTGGGDDTGDTGYSAEGADTATTSDNESTSTDTGATEAQGASGKSALKAHLAELKASNPALYRELNDMRWGYQNLKEQISKNFPGGIKDAIALKQEIEQAGGREAIEQLSSEVNDYRQLDDLWLNGDARFLDQAIESGGKEGFVKLAPQLSNKWAEVDPEGYDKHFAGVMYNTLRNAEIPTELRMAVLTLGQFDLEKSPQLKAISESLSRAYNWMVKDLRETATKEIKREQPNPALEQERSSLNSEKMAVVTQGIQQRLFSSSAPVIDKVIADLRKGNPLAEGGRQQLHSDTFTRIFKILSADPAVEQKYDAYLDSGDKEGAEKFLKSKVEPLLQKEAAKAYKHLYGEATLGSPKPKPNGKEAPKKPAAEVGFELVGYDPKPNSIDRNKTTNAMIFKNQAILKNGRKVTWRPGAPPEK